MSVPIVAVELHDQTGSRHEGIDAELPADEMLREIVNAERVEKAAGQGADRLLLSVSRGASTLDDVLGQLDAAAGRIGLGR